MESHPCLLIKPYGWDLIRWDHHKGQRSTRHIGSWLELWRGLKRASMPSGGRRGRFIWGNREVHTLSCKPDQAVCEQIPRISVSCDVLIEKSVLYKSRAENAAVKGPTRWRSADADITAWDSRYMHSLTHTVSVSFLPDDDKAGGENI